MSADRSLVSVIMPTFNAAPFVAESIESVLAQTYDPIELVIVDDASADDTLQIVEEYAQRYSEQVRFRRGTERLGPCRRRNDALDLARGSLIGWLDHDDLWSREKTAKEVAVLQARPDVGLVYSGYEAFDSDTREPIPWRDRNSEAEGDVLVPLFVRGCFVASLTALFRREVLTRRHLRLRETDFSFGDDYYLWLVLSLDWKVARIDEVLAYYRRHGGNESERLGETNFHLRRVDLLRQFLDEFPEAIPRLGKWRRRGLARHYLSAAHFESKRSRLRSRLTFARAFASAPVYTHRQLRAQASDGSQAQADASGSP
jgi:glycosyltransferase involved in cell wall biosynthesis